MKLAWKVTLGLLGAAAVLAASQEPIRTAAADGICCLLTALGLC